MQMDQANTAAGPDPADRGDRSLFAAIYHQLDIAFSRIGDHRTTDWAAAFTYYAMLAIFPALLVLVSVIGLTAGSVLDQAIAEIRDVAPGEVGDFFIDAINGLRNGNTAGLILTGGLITSLYSASSYVGCYIRASGVVLHIKERRRFYKTIPLRIALTSLLILLILATTLAVVLTGPLLDRVSDYVGIADDGLGGWELLKWPLVAFLAILALAILKAFGPDYERYEFKLFTPGIVLTVILWGIASIGFSFYVSNFGNFNRVYGSLAGVVIFLIWMYLINLSVLLGLEFDNELRRFCDKHGYGAFSRERRQRARANS